MTENGLERWTPPKNAFGANGFSPQHGLQPSRGKSAYSRNRPRRGTVQVVSAQRCEFKFDSLSIRTPARTIKLPPFGQGWFDTVYVDSQLRVARDVRGDTLVTTRSKLPLDSWQ